MEHVAWSSTRDYRCITAGARAHDAAVTLNHRPKAHAALAATLVALILAACSQQASQEGSADPTVEATPSPSATPEPTLAPAEAFVAYLTDGRFTATADLSGTLVANEESADVTGEWMVSGADFHLALDVGAGPTAEQAVVDGQNYIRQPPKPWRRDIQASIPSDRDFATVLAELRWQPSGEGELVASAAGIDEALTLLGLVDQSVEVDDATLTVRIDRRGVPTEIRVEADVHRLEGDPLLIGWDVVYSLHDVGRAHDGQEARGVDSTRIGPGLFDAPSGNVERYIGARGGGVPRL